MIDNNNDPALEKLSEELVARLFEIHVPVMHPVLDLLFWHRLRSGAVLCVRQGQLAGIPGVEIHFLKPKTL